MKRKNNEPKATPGKKFKQMTMFDCFSKTPKVVISPLKMPLSDIKDKPKLTSETSKTLLQPSTGKLNIKPEIKSSDKPLPSLKQKSQNITSKAENNNLNKKTAKVLKNNLDGIIEYKNLPQLTPLSIPHGIESENFSNALLVSQFLTDFRGALKLPKTLTISLDSLLNSISRGVQGYDYVGTVLTHFAKAVVLDREEVIELGVKLSDVPVTIYSVSEIIRQCLSAGGDCLEIGQLLNRLKSQEIYELTPSAIIDILSNICSKAFDCRIVETYVTKFAKQKEELYRQRSNIVNLKKELISKDLKLKELNEQKLTEQQDTALTPINFYGSAFVEATNQTSTPSSIKRKITSEKLRLEKAKADSERQERIKEEREIAKMEATIDKFEKDFKTVVVESNKMKRAIPLGKDRNNDRYWWFNHTSPNLLIEKDWQYTDSPSCSRSKWFTYNDDEKLQQLLDSLCVLDKDELLLKSALKRKIEDLPKISDSISDQPDEVLNWNEKLMETLKDEMQKAMSIIITKPLGWMNNVDAWQEKLTNSRKLLHMRKLLVEMFECLYPSSFAKDTMDDTGLQRWVTAVQESQTLSRLHFLLSVLSTRVNWNNASYRKCKVCRRRGSRMMLCCFECDENFHLECLEKSLLCTPKKNWICSSCDNSTKSLLNESQDNYSSYTEDDEKDDDEEESKEFLKCTGCKRKDNKVFGCDECSVAYHKDCHKPPLRNIPRGTWVCGKCRQKMAATPVTPRIGKKSKRVKMAKRTQLFRGKEIRRSQRLR